MKVRKKIKTCCLSVVNKTGQWLIYIVFLIVVFVLFYANEMFILRQDNTENRSRPHE